jgi:hypothetical protein
MIVVLGVAVSRYKIAETDSFNPTTTSNNSNLFSIGIDQSFGQVLYTFFNVHVSVVAFSVVCVVLYMRKLLSCLR